MSGFFRIELARPKLCPPIVIPLLISSSLEIESVYDFKNIFFDFDFKISVHVSITHDLGLLRFMLRPTLRLASIISLSNCCSSVGELAKIMISSANLR